MSGHEIQIEKWNLFPFAIERQPTIDIVAEHGRQDAMEAIIKMAQHTLISNGIPQKSYLPVFDPLIEAPKERDVEYELLMTNPITLLESKAHNCFHPDSENFPEVSISHAPMVHGRYIINPAVLSLEVDDWDGHRNLLTISMTGKEARRNMRPSVDPIVTGDGRVLSDEDLQEVFETIIQINKGLRADDEEVIDLRFTRRNDTYPCLSGQIGRAVQAVMDKEFGEMIGRFNT